MLQKSQPCETLPCTIVFTQVIQSSPCQKVRWGNILKVSRVTERKIRRGGENEVYITQTPSPVTTF